MNNGHGNISAYRVKSNAHYICQECGSTEYIQAHHRIPNDDSTLIVLCAECHSKKHPSVPRKLFFSNNCQPYWSNVSASTLAREVGVHPRTIWRLLKRLKINKGYLSDETRALIIREILPLSYPEEEQHEKEGQQIEDTSKFKFKCNNCGHIWRPLLKQVKVCPSCRSYFWNKDWDDEKESWVIKYDIVEKVNNKANNYELIFAQILACKKDGLRWRQMSKKLHIPIGSLSVIYWRQRQMGLL